MKRFLSLVLTLVMVMSLVTVSAGAKDFTDDDSITYDEAVAVISEIGVVDGYADGDFKPANTLTRQAAAKIICNLILGPTTAAELHADTAPYRDVPANGEFAGYIAYCQKEGIISGYADGSFRPGGTLTGYAFMKMLLGALGYDATLESYVGANWSINVAKQAIGIGLNKGLVEEFNGIKAVTREEACLYAFNTLQADLVEYGQRLTTNINGTEVTLSSGGAQSREWKSQQTRINNIIDDDVIQFAEEYFSKLVKTPDSDKFERPAHTWIYDKKIQIGTWMDQDKLVETYTTGVSGRDLYDLLGSAVIRDFDLEIYVDGHAANNSTTQYNQYVNADKNGKFLGTYEEFTMADLKRSNTDDLGATGDGVLTEVFKDDDNETIIITSIHTWLAQATSSYNESKESASVKVHMKLVDGSKAGSLDLVSVTKTVALDDVPGVSDVSTDDFYLVRMSDKDTTLLEVVDMEEPEILEQSTITKFSLSTKYSKGEDGLRYPSKLTTGGTEYADSDRACYDVDVLDQYDQDLLTTNTYNIYLDKYGYFIGIDLFEGTKQYVFVTGYDMKNSNLSVKTAEASGIFLDGTMETMTVNVKDTNKNIEEMVTKKSDDNAIAYYQAWGVNASDGVYLLNRWYTYTKNEAGVYTLKPCVNKDGEAMMLAAKSENADDDDGPKSLKMNCSSLRLDGVTNSQGLLQGETMKYLAEGLAPHRAYGEDNSVFITVDVDEVSAKAGGSATATQLNITKAITDVNGVYSGVQDVDLFSAYDNRVVGQYWYDNATPATVVAKKNTTLGANDNNDGFWVGHDGKDNTSLNNEGEPWTSGTEYSYIGENAYAVFDRNNFIIGAVILGDAVGSNATKAYILDPVKYERYENGTYYWQFEAVINGEIVKQEAESKFRDTIDTMRNNQFEIVELRYKGADQEIVTDVKELKRTDDNTDLDKAQDNIYGYPFKEITSNGHRVLDKESVYDVVLTGLDDGDTAFTTWKSFTYVSRPRENDMEHDDKTGSSLNENVFLASAEGTLRLQGRTLYVLDGQVDYGIDFVSGAKAVVRQREGTPEINSWENRQYTSVQEAIDSLGDPNPATGEKEFRGIITAALDSRGVAEWVVFYSDTLAETKNNTSVGGATIDVEIRTELPGGKAEFYEIRKVARPTDGTDIATIQAPDLSAKGLTPERNYVYLQWKKYDERPIVTFVYTENGAPNPGPTGDTFAIRVGYALKGDYSAGGPDADDRIGAYEEIAIPLSASGYGTLTKDDLKKIPDGYMLDSSATSGTDTDLGTEVNGNDSSQERTLCVAVVPRTDITAIELAGATKGDVKYGTTIASGAAAELKASGVKFKLTFGTTQGAACSVTVNADDTVFLQGIADATTGGTASATVNGKLTVTAKGTAAAKVDVPVEIYAAIASDAITAAGGTQIATGYSVTAPTLPVNKVKVGDTVDITFTADTAGATTLGENVTITVTGGTAVASNTSVVQGTAADPSGTPAATAAKVSLTVTVNSITGAALAIAVSVAA